MEPTVDRFRALARSSPWRWSTLRYVQHKGSDGSEQEPVRILIRRPNLARVERLDGTLEQVTRSEPQTAGLLTFGGRGQQTITLPGPEEVEVELDDDGLIRQRPSRMELDTDAPMVGNYYDVALLDPVELADDNDGGPGATMEQLRTVDHHGRQAWEATLRPTASYDPRCSCCQLLLSEVLEEESGPSPRDADPSFTYPDAHRVRLDIATGVCVLIEQLGGTRSGSGHDLEIEAVDEAMGDELFPQHPPPSRWSKLLGRR